MIELEMMELRGNHNSWKANGNALHNVFCSEIWYLEIEIEWTTTHFLHNKKSVIKSMFVYSFWQIGCYRSESNELVVNKLTLTGCPVRRDRLQISRSGNLIKWTFLAIHDRRHYIFRSNSRKLSVRRNAHKRRLWLNSIGRVNIY